MGEHYRRALAVIAAAATGDVILGAAFGSADHIGLGNGLYFATTIATTTGNSPYFPHGWLPYLLAVAMHVTVLPLWLAAFSLLTSALTAGHLSRAEQRITEHVSSALHHHLARPGDSNPMRSQS